MSGHGWRYVLGVAQTFAAVSSIGDAARVAARIAAECDADERLSMDLRPDRIVLTVANPAVGRITAADAELTVQISAVLAGLGLRPNAQAGPGQDRSVQVLEIAIDALDIAAIRPFWRAVLGYGDEPGRSGPLEAIVDPAGQGPAIGFQQRTTPRPPRNRILLVISVPHDEAAGRLQAALSAGGVLVSDDRAPAFWVLADAEGNEACITTWQGRDP